MCLALSPDPLYTPCRFASGVTGLDVNDGMKPLSPPATFCTTPLPLLLLCLPVFLTLWRRSSRTSFQQLGWILHASTWCTHLLRARLSLLALMTTFDCMIDYQHHFSWGKLSFFSYYLLDFFSSAPSTLSVFFANIST